MFTLYSAETPRKNHGIYVVYIYVDIINRALAVF